MESHYIKRTYPQINATHKKVTLKLTLLFNINPDNIQYNNSEKKEETILLQQSHTPSLKKYSRACKGIRDQIFERSGRYSNCETDWKDVPISTEFYIFTVTF